MDLVVDAAAAEDGRAVAALWRAHLAAEGVVAAATLEHWVGQFLALPRGGHVLVARLGEEIRGAALLLRTPAVLVPSQQWTLELLATLPGERGSGVGAALLRHIQERARLEGVSRVLVPVRAESAHSRRVLEAHGFTVDPAVVMAWAPTPPPVGELLQALLAGNAVRVAGLLARGADPDAADAHGVTALHHACQRGDVTVVAALLRAGANMNARDEDGRTPLMVAAAFGHDLCVEQLLEAGADVHGRNRAGRTALDFVGEMVATDEDNARANHIHAALLARGATR
jgi:GNAT superfamily N-acetyltransferase